MSVAIIDQLKMVQVDDDNRQRLFGPFGPFDGVAQGNVKNLAIVQPRQGVCRCHFFQSVLESRNRQEYGQPRDKNRNQANDDIQGNAAPRRLCRVRFALFHHQDPFQLWNIARVQQNRFVVLLKFKALSRILQDGIGNVAYARNGVDILSIADLSIGVQRDIAGLIDEIDRAAEIAAIAIDDLPHRVQIHANAGHTDESILIVINTIIYENCGLVVLLLVRIDIDFIIRCHAAHAKKPFIAGVIFIDGLGNAAEMVIVPGKFRNEKGREEAIFRPNGFQITCHRLGICFTGQYPIPQKGIIGHLRRNKDRLYQVGLNFGIDRIACQRQLCLNNTLFQGIPGYMITCHCCADKSHRQNQSNNREQTPSH